ncbi:MAG: Gfo/Idh/MocA family oxidoreductase [Chloroflexota bacterium]|nr:Gfo/Idh/MocA family oxidoreductase [Chloroflexota bacterium]
MRIAIIGCGEIGRAYGALLQEQTSAEVTWVVDADPDRAQAGARAMGSSSWSTDAAAALRHPDVDAVIVASPHATHPQFACQALDLGLHVLLEAPLALRFPDAQRVLASARASSTVLAVNFWARDALEIRRIRGRIPRPTFVRIEAVVDSLGDSWMASAEHGGLLGLLGSHALDLASYLMQSAPLYVQALGGRHTRRSDLADTVSAGIRFRNGGLARLTIGEYGHSSTTTAWHILVTDGMITETANGDLMNGQPNVGSVLQRGAPDSGSQGGSQLASLNAFLKAVAAGDPPLAGVEDGARATQLADAVYEAMGGRRRIAIPELSLQVGAGPVYIDDSVPNRPNHGLGA